MSGFMEHTLNWDNLFQLIIKVVEQIMESLNYKKRVYWITSQKQTFCCLFTVFYNDLNSLSHGLELMRNYFYQVTSSFLE